MECVEFIINKEGTLKVLILGSGGREHAITWKYAASKRISGLYIAPGNAGTGELGINLPDLDPENPQAVLEACHEYGIDHVFVGSEGPLSLGIVDELEKNGINAIGPHKSAAQMEASKVFSKKFMLKHGIPTAEAREFSDPVSFESYMRETTKRMVIKKSGLAAGKGVLESTDKEELISFGKEVLKTDSLLAEEFLDGYEISIFALTDGKDFVLLPTCADFKKAKEGGEGLNTGGMGAICPVPIVSHDDMDLINETVIAPTFEGMKKDGLNYKGVLYFGLMITEEGPKLLEYNTRFGDPETQVLLPLIESDFGNLTDAMVQGRLKDFPLRISHNSALCVVVAAQGYPGAYETGIPVKPIPVFPESDAVVFHASTGTNDNNQVITGGGRCFTVVGIGQNILNANVRAYEAIKRIDFDGAWHRSDIGKKFFTE